MIKKRFEAMVSRAVHQHGVPENQVTPYVRKIGRGLLLTSILLIVPLVLFDNVHLAVKIGLQLGYAALMCAGLLLAFDEEEKRR